MVVFKRTDIQLLNNSLGIMHRGEAEKHIYYCNERAGTRSRTLDLRARGPAIDCAAKARSNGRVDFCAYKSRVVTLKSLTVSLKGCAF